jgi:electron transport complex protein RnfD
MAGIILSSPHTIRPNRVDWLMLQVILALIPGILALIWYFGWGVGINLVLASLFAVLVETAVLKLRGRPLLPTLRDLSALVTAMLFAIAVPPTLPWWLTLMGMVFAIGVTKQLYGGLGYNPFNPAMAGYVFLLVSYPLPTCSPSTVSAFWTRRA